MHHRQNIGIDDISPTSEMVGETHIFWFVKWRFERSTKIINFLNFSDLQWRNFVPKRRLYILEIYEIPAKTQQCIWNCFGSFYASFGSKQQISDFKVI